MYRTMTKHIDIHSGSMCEEHSYYTEESTTDSEDRHGH